MKNLGTRICELESELEKRPTYRELVERQLENEIKLETHSSYFYLSVKYRIYIGDEFFEEYLGTIDDDTIFEKIWKNKDMFNRMIKFDKKVSKYKKEIEPIRKKYFKGGDVNE